MSCFDSDGKDGGVIAAAGFVAGTGGVENSDEYISPGADRRDSAGDVSSLPTEELCSSRVAILAKLMAGSDEIFEDPLLTSMLSGVVVAVGENRGVF